jgi:hypothetical protein
MSVSGISRTSEVICKLENKFNKKKKVEKKNTHNSLTKFVYIDQQINSIMKDKTILVQHKIKTLHILVHKFSNYLLS